MIHLKSNNTLKSLKFPFGRLAVWLWILLLASCASVEQKAAKAPAKAPAAADQAAPAAAKAEPPSPEDYPVAPFTKDSLYQLLVGEIAGYRGEYDTALQKYLKVTLETRDPGVAARTTRLAAYLKHDDIALKAARVWVETDPDDVDAHRYAADLLMKAGDLEGAVYELEAVKRLGGMADFPMFAYQAANLDPKSRDNLLVAITHMMKEYPDDQQLVFAKAVLLEQNERYQEALALADKLLEQGADINVVILKVDALKQLHKLDEAAAFLKKQIDAMGDNRRLRLIYARLLFQDNRLDEARQQYEMVNKQSPSDGDVLFALALIALQQDDDKAASGYLKQMLRWNRRPNEAHFYLGSIAEKRHEIPRAIEEYRQVDDGYEYLPAQSRIASLMFDQGREEDARTWLENQRARNPEYYDQLTMVEAQLLSDRGQEKAVFDFLDKAIDKDPKNVDLLYFRAMTGEKFGHLDILERDLKKIISIDPDNADALNALGYTLADKTDRHEEALKLIQRALEIKPGEAAYIDSLGWAMYRLKRYDEAVTQLRKALSMFPNDEVAAHLGEVLWVMGKKSEATDVWQKGLERKPDSEVLKQVIQRFTGK